MQRLWQDTAARPDTHRGSYDDSEFGPPHRLTTIDTGTPRLDDHPENSLKYESENNGKSCGIARCYDVPVSKHKKKRERTEAFDLEPGEDLRRERSAFFLAAPIPLGYTAIRIMLSCGLLFISTSLSVN